MKKLFVMLITCVLVLSVSAPFVSADSSPEGKKTYKVTINMSDGKAESFTFLQKGENVILKSSVKKNDPAKTFIKWEITGDYEVISGSLTNPDLVIKPLSDVSVVQVLADIAENQPDKSDKDDNDDDKESQGDKNDSETSPPTGNNIWLALGGVMLASAALSLIAKRRLN